MGDIATNIVDWIYLELRSTVSSSSTFFKGTYFLSKEGYITDSKGAPITIEKPDDLDFYLVIESRNHLGVMSANKLSVVGGGIVYNFTNAQSKAYSTGSLAMVEVQSGVFALMTGDVNGDGTINANDAFGWYQDSGNSKYVGGDLDMDGDVDNNDRILWMARNGYSIQFPKFE